MSRPPAPAPIVSLEDYRRRLAKPTYWEPWIRAALTDAGLPQPTRLWLGRDVSNPTFVADTKVIVKLFPDYRPRDPPVEWEVYRLIEGAGLPVPRILASGDLYGGGPGWRWPYLVLEQLPGKPFAEVGSGLSPEDRLRFARDCGTFMRGLHRTPLEREGVLAPDSDRFLALLRRRRRDVPDDERRWGHLSPSACRQLPEVLPEDPASLLSPDAPPVLVHADMHAEHLFVNPRNGELTGVIDFDDAYAGDWRYDLLALHFGTFRADKGLLEACLEAYGAPAGDEVWISRMLAFTFLHEFDVLAEIAEGALQDVPDLDSLARLLWDPSVPGIAPPW